MRANFIIPAKGDFLKYVLYAELGLGRERERVEGVGEKCTHSHFPGCSLAHSVVEQCSSASF